MPTTQLLDARNFDAHIDTLVSEISAAELLGIDCETQDEARHAGLNAFNNAKRHVFDHRRTTMTGFSLYRDGSDVSWYVNLAHADEANRLSDQQRDRILEALAQSPAILLAHNAPFELVMFEQCLGQRLRNILCTMQLAVSHHGPDEYNWQKFLATPLKGILPITRDIISAFSSYDPDTRGQNLTSAQADVLGKFISKTSDARHSYNGFVKEIAYGYGLKQLVKSLFGYQMQTFDEVLKAAGAKHMGELTGEQVCDYGADDAYWAVEVYKTLRDDMLQNNPAAFVTFLKQENPMIHVYAESWRDGLRLDLNEVYSRRDVERANMARVLREFKVTLKQMLPFDEEINQKLADREAWYAKHWQTKRSEIESWIFSADSEDDFEQVTQISNPIGNAWAEERGVALGKRLNLTHYYGMRTILYDLMGHKIIYSDGKVASDADARGKMLLNYERSGDDLHVKALKQIQEMAGIEQRMKLYLTPYTQLMDPETSRVYPSLSSRLATRRMATSFPNPMQLAKQGESTYIRGFYLADDDDSVVVSADWSSVELVLIGDASGDEEFARVLGQLPYGDLHSGAAVDGLGLRHYPGLTEEEFRGFKFGENPNNRDLRDTSTGEPLPPPAFFKHARTSVGKTSSFGYWFSGALSSVGINLGWTSEEMWEATERYRQRFAGAEQWRVRTQDEASENGYVTLPDGHRRVRVEATEAWASVMRQKFADIDASPAMMNFANLALKRIRARARNQAVNAMIQGSCATLAKQSIINLKGMLEEAGIADKVRFLIPIHDELVYSVQRDAVMKFLPLLRKAMSEHPKIMKSLPLDCTVAIGKTFRPFDGKLTGQIELDEAPFIEGVIAKEWQGKKLPDHLVERVVDAIFDGPQTDMGQAA